MTVLILQPPYKVELGSPKKTVLVEVMKATAAIGVVEDYKLLGKLNLRELSMIGDDDADEDSKASKQPTSEPASDAAAEVSTAIKEADAQLEQVAPTTMEPLLDKPQEGGA